LSRKNLRELDPKESELDSFALSHPDGQSCRTKIVKDMGVTPLNMGKVFALAGLCRPLGDPETRGIGGSKSSKMV
jgi:hypothetical protein